MTLFRSDGLNKASDLHRILSGQLKQSRALWPQSCLANNSGMSITTALQMRWHVITEPDLSERLPANSGDDASPARTPPFSASYLSALVTRGRPHDKVTVGSRPPARRCGSAPLQGYNSATGRRRWIPLIMMSRNTLISAETLARHLEG